MKYFKLCFFGKRTSKSPVNFTLAEWLDLDKINFRCSDMAGGFWSNHCKSLTFSFINSVGREFMLLQSIQFSRSVVSDSLWPHELQHTRPLCPSPTPWVHSDSCPLSQWCHPAISSSVIPFSFCPQSLPASESFPMSQLCMRWPKYWSFIFSIIPSKEIPG